VKKSHVGLWQGIPYATLEGRHSRYAMPAEFSGRHTQKGANALIKQSRKLPNKHCKSLILDRGHEPADHKRFVMETNIDVYSTLMPLQFR